MSEFLHLFLYVPYAVLFVAWALFVRRLPCRWWGKALWLLWLAFCCSMFLGFRRFGKHNMCPELSVALTWFWNWAYCGAMLLCGLAAVFFFRFRHRGVVLPLVAWGLSAWGLWNAVRPPRVHELTFAYPDLPAELDGYRLVHISDLHAADALPAWHTRAVVETANALRPDLICLTGDYADGDAERLHDVLAPIRDLRAKDGVWAVTGNHDWFQLNDGWWKWYRRWGLRLLENECVFPRKSLALGGVNDEFCRNRPEVARARLPDVAKTFATATNGEFRILLDHQPQSMPVNRARHRVRLQLSGHTHGGVMPGLASLVRYLHGGFVRGPYRLGDSVLYVSPGCGQNASFLMRFFDPTEVALITLRKGDPSE